MAADLTVRDLADATGLSIRVAVGGDRLDDPVRWAHSTELLDPRPYLRGGELVLTVGSGLTDAERCIAFVNALTESRASALGLGIGDVHQHPPAELVTACEAVALPLLLIPPSTPFIEITELLSDFRIRMASDRSRRAIAGRLIDAIYRHQAAPEVMHEDVRTAGLRIEALVASIWRLDMSEELERMLDATPHLLGELPDFTLLLTADADVPGRCSTRLGVMCALSEVFSFDDIASAMASPVEAWHRAVLRSDSGSDEERPGPIPPETDRPHFTHLVDEVSESALTPLLTQLMVPLEAHDAATGTRLIVSLETFLQHDGSVQAAARTMHLHPNSLRNRLNRVYELTGRNPLLFRDQIDFALALQARRRRSETPSS